MLNLSSAASLILIVSIFETQVTRTIYISLLRIRGVTRGEKGLKNVKGLIALTVLAVAFAGALYLLPASGHPYWLDEEQGDGFQPPMWDDEGLNGSYGAWNQSYPGCPWGYLGPEDGEPGWRYPPWYDPEQGTPEGGEPGDDEPRGYYPGPGCGGMMGGGYRRGGYGPRGGGYGRGGRSSRWGSS